MTAIVATHKDIFMSSKIRDFATQNHHFNVFSGWCRHKLRHAYHLPQLKHSAVDEVYGEFQESSSLRIAQYVRGSEKRGHFGPDLHFEILIFSELIGN